MVRLLICCFCGLVVVHSRPQKRSLGEDLKASGGKLIKMGSAELTRLWNLCPDNLAACRDHKRYVRKRDYAYSLCVRKFTDCLNHKFS